MAKIKGFIKQLYKTLIPERQRINLRYAQFQFRGWAYRGQAVHCDCCGGDFSQFLPYGNQLSQRENAACPRCNALERNRMLWRYLRDDLQIGQKNWRVLHFAPERSLERQLRALPNLYYTTTDLNPQYADVAADIAALPFADGTFDLVICSHVLAHVPDEFAALQELFRITKAGGKTLILTRIDDSLATTYEPGGIQSAADSLQLLGQDDLFRIHGKDYVARLQQAAAWQVAALYPAQKMDEKAQKRFGVRPEEAIFECLIS